ncbi:MAG TPA: hypothetical protein VIJ64_06055 [Candidatus Lustribacter sp.]
MTAERLLRSFTVGAATGLRTTAGPASAFAARSGNWNWAFRIAALGELIADKLPSTPARTMPLGLAARAIAGGVAGASLADAAGDRWIAAACAVSGAMLTAYAGVAYRRETAKRNMSPFIAALLEDGAAIALAWAAVPRR